MKNKRTKNIRILNLQWPPFSRLNDEQGQHGVCHVVVVEFPLAPIPVVDGGHVPPIHLLILEEIAPVVKNIIQALLGKYPM